MGSSRRVMVGPVPLGGGAPVVIQTMTNTKTHNIEATYCQAKKLYESGADLVRIAVPDSDAVKAFAEIKRRLNKPLIADIHYDYRLAIAALAAGAEKVRINPGNIGSWDRVREIIKEAGRRNAAIRIGVNSGSLEKELLDKYGRPCAEALVESAITWEQRFLDAGFDNIVLSVKSPDVREMVRANRLLAERSTSPIHLGVTEAGTSFSGTIKSAVGIGSLLLDNIGDTLRVSLTADPVKEVQAALKICQTVGLKKHGIEIISCPTCGRTNHDLIGLVEEFEKRTLWVRKPLKVAIMGCAVNGPGEAKQADFGFALGKGRGVIFRKGKIIKVVDEQDYLTALLQEVENHL